MKECRVIFIGIGNMLRGDDAVGVVLAQRLRLEISIIDAGITPENYLGKIINLNPEEVWIIDALDFGATPGEYKVFKAEELSSDHLFFTHNFSLELFCEYLKKNIQAVIFILGIQPKSTEFSQRLSEEVEIALPEIEKKLIGIARVKGGIV